jgi:hypothetical protein
MSNSQQRLFAREVATARELTVEELKLVAGGMITTNNGMDCGPGTFQSHCGSSDDDPCDLDWHDYD